MILTKDEIISIVCDRLGMFSNDAVEDLADELIRRCNVSQNSGKPIVSGSFTIIDWCKCKHCGHEVSPSQCDHMGKMLFSDDREYVVGFECWQCTEWIPFPKNCR